MINHVNRRSLKASETGIAKAVDALTDRAWNREKLAEEVGCSVQPVKSFFTGKRVKRELFVEMCQKLELNWREIADLPKPGIEPVEPKQDNNIDIEALVQQVRLSRQEKIQYQCGSLRMLDVARAIALTDIFTEVNVLEQITSQQWRNISELVRDFNPELNNFDRLGLGRVHQARVSGLDAVSRYQKLMVLGKPGSGKTTFLQHIAIKCNQGEFEPQRVPIFIKLKEFAEDAKDQGKFDLLDYVIQEFNNDEIAPEVTNKLITEGKALILIDGLDEVAEEDSDKVVREIRRLAQNYHQNYFVITCRIAAFYHQFQGFTDVEVADFNSEQVESFAQKWFVAVAGKNQSKGEALAHQFIDKLLRPENQAIRELAVTPILLNLTCLVFQANADFPTNRSRLYEQGLDILLRRWDEARGICRDEVYHSLTLARKKQLLSQLAAMTFEQGDYFFEQSKIQRIITDYLQTIPDARTDPDELLLDSEAVLKSIEVQHGLLVERARGIYSFSHLTFQEYFTARKIVDSSAPKSLKKLINHISKKQWQEVFLLTSGMLPNAEHLLQLMKQNIDRMLAKDEKLQQFLTWLNQKALLVNAPYKQEIIRAFYLGRQMDIIERSSNLNSDPALTLAVASALDPTFFPPLDLTINISLPYDNRDRDFAIDDRDFAIDIVLDLAITYARDLDLPYVYAGASAVNLVSVLTFASNFDLDPNFLQSINQLKEQLPGFTEIRRERGWWRREREWWRTYGRNWTEQLIKLLIEHRSIGHDWKWTYQQKKLLYQYYFANRLLIKCLNSADNLTPAVLEEIEETLLLPIAEIEQRASYKGLLTTGYKKWCNKAI